MIGRVTAGVRLLHKLLEIFQNVSRNFSKSCSKVRLFFKVISRNDNFWKKIVGADKRRPLRRKLPVQNHTLLKTSNGETVYPVYSLRSRRLEVVGERENGRARETLSFSRARFFLVPTTSKRLLRRLPSLRLKTLKTISSSAVQRNISV